MSKLLKLSGWIVDVAEGLGAGIALLDQCPEVVILDLMLPDGGGDELLAHVRRERLPIRVAVITGTSDRRRLDVIHRLNPDLLLQKPIDFQSLSGILDP